MRSSWEIRGTESQAAHLAVWPRATRSARFLATPLRAARLGLLPVPRCWQSIPRWMSWHAEIIYSCELTQLIPEARSLSTPRTLLLWHRPRRWLRSTARPGSRRIRPTWYPLLISNQTSFPRLIGRRAMRSSRSSRPILAPHLQSSMMRFACQTKLQRKDSHRILISPRLHRPRVIYRVEE